MILFRWFCSVRSPYIIIPKSLWFCFINFLVLCPVIPSHGLSLCNLHRSLQQPVLKVSYISLTSSTNIFIKLFTLCHIIYVNLNKIKATAEPLIYSICCINLQENIVHYNCSCMSSIKQLQFSNFICTLQKLSFGIYLFVYFLKLQWKQCAKLPASPKWYPPLIKAQCDDTYWNPKCFDAWFSFRNWAHLLSQSLQTTLVRGIILEFNGRFLFSL